MNRLSPPSHIPMRRFARIAIAVLAITSIIFLLRRTVLDALVIVAGGAGIAFLVQPLAMLYEKRLPRNPASLCALLTCLVGLLLILWLLLPALVSEAAQLVESLPQSVEVVREMMLNAADWLNAHLPGISLPSSIPEGNAIPKLAKSTIDFAGGIADFFYRSSLMVVLSYFFLCDRKKLLLRLELLIPRSMRNTAVRIGNAVCRELKLYLRGQGMIAAMVGILSAIALYFVQVRSALVLGAIIGVLNMIPYFGPVIGAVPAVLMALTGGWMTAIKAAAVLWLVQQIDSTLISPRVMGSLSGMSPAAVLLAIFVGSGLGGIVGMLLAVPAVMAYRTVFRVFVQRYENV